MRNSIKAQRESSTVVVQTTEHWAFQYITSAQADHRIWWPVEGIGEYVTEQAALEAAKSWKYKKVRTMRVRVTVEYGRPVVVEEANSGAEDAGPGAGSEGVGAGVSDAGAVPVADEAGTAVPAPPVSEA